MIRSLLFVALAAALAGCGKSTPDDPKVKVEGVVKLDGKPLPAGQLTFDAGAGKVPAVFDIQDGKFTGQSPVGKVRVQVVSYQPQDLRKKTKMDGPGYDKPVMVNVLPAKYNTASTITREVYPTGENVYDFELKSK